MQKDWEDEAVELIWFILFHKRQQTANFLHASNLQTKNNKIYIYI